MNSKLLPEEIHLWSANIDRVEFDVFEFANLLSVDELARANRFAKNIHRNRFVASHAILRMIIAGYSSTDPRAINFKYAVNGKPFLEKYISGQDFRINMSHSNGFFVFAICVNHDVGVDIEYIEQSKNLSGLANRFYLKSESKRAEDFYKLWTAKEAMAKSLGERLSFALHNIEVNIDGEGNSNAEGWRLYSFTPAPNYIGTIASQHSFARIVQLQWS